MTDADINNSRTEVQIITTGHWETVAGVDSQWESVNISGMGVDKSIWDGALASAADALVLIQWLESKRTD